MNATYKLALLFAVWMGAFSGATAATLTTFTGGDPGEGLDLDGSFLYAIHADTSGNPIAGDAIFQPRSANGATFNFPSQTSFGAPNYGATANDDAIEQVNDFVIYGEPATIDLARLIPGRQYKLQLLYNEACCNRRFDVNIEGATVMSDIYPGGLQVPLYNQSIGVVFTHSFTATDNTLNINLNGPGTGTDANPIFDALTLEQLDNVSITTVTGGDAGEGLSFVPANMVVAVDVNGLGGVVQGVNFVSEAAASGIATVNSQHTTVGAVNYGVSANDVALNAIMTDIRYSANNPTTVTADVQVTPGRFYEVGLLIDSSAYNTRTQDITIDGVTVADNLVVAGPVGPATWLVRYQFYAPDSLINIVLGPSGLVGNNPVGGDNNAVLNAFYVQLVPEPTSGTLMLLGIVGLWSRCRKGRAK